MAKDVKLDFDPLTRAESIMAQEAKFGLEGGTFAMSVERREQVRDLIMFSQAQSLKRIADAVAGHSDGSSSGIVHALHDLVPR